VPPELTDRILVWSLSDTDAYTLESCDWCSADSIGNVYFLTSQFIERQLELFYGLFSERFKLAEFPDVGEQMESFEVTVFLKAAGAPSDADFSSIENYDCFSGLRAVIHHRLEQRSLEQIKLAAELFNWTIECGLYLADTNSQAVIRVGFVAEVAPFLLERILNRLLGNAKRGDPANQLPSSDFERRFLPFVPVLETLNATVKSADWVQNQLALRIFFWIADMYNVDVETFVQELMEA